MKILVIGYGSIGKRHAMNVKAAGHEVILLRHSKDNPNSDGLKEYYSFEEAAASEEINGTIVCSPTSKHMNDVELLVQGELECDAVRVPAVVGAVVGQKVDGRLVP